MIEQQHHFIFSHYEKDWVDWEPTQPYEATLAVLACSRCGYIKHHVVITNETECIDNDWPKIYALKDVS